MSKQTKAALLAAAWLLIAGRAGAQSPQSGAGERPFAEQYIDTTNGLSLAAAIAQAIDREPALRAARADIEVARGRRLQADLKPNPTVSVERRIQAAGSDNQTMVQMDWPLDLSRRSARVATADLEVGVMERAIDDRIRILVGDVRQRYGQAAAAIRDVAVADDLAASLQQAFDLLRRRVDAGAAPPLDRDLMEVELHRVEADRFLAAGRAAAAMFELRRAMGMGAGARLLLRDTLEMLAPPPETGSQGAAVESTVDAAVVGQRADVREAEARVNLAGSRLAVARSESQFDVSLFGSYVRMDQAFPQTGFGASGGLEQVGGVFHYVSAGAMVTVPLRNRNQGEIAVARAEEVGAAARLEAVHVAAEAELAAAAVVATQSRRGLALIETSVRLSRQNLDTLRQTYELGRATVSDVLAEQRRYLDVERAYTATLTAVFEAQTALQRARGER